MFVNVLIAITTAVTVLTFYCVQCNDVSPETTTTVELEIEEILGDDPAFGNNSVELIGTENPDLNQTTQTTLDSSTPTTIPSLVTIGYVTRPLNCNHNQVESQCVNSCESNCEEQEKPRCKPRYCWRGCECKPGYVRDRRNWSCIAKEECPKCATNEHYRHCEYSCSSEPNCVNYQNFKPHCINGERGRRIRNCVSGCFCDYGFVRDESRNGTCVLPSKCPQKCGPNEYYEESGKPCVRTFADPQPKCLDMKQEPTCVCNTGFVRNPRTKICEPHSNLVEKCGANQTFSYCSSTCAERCLEKYSNRRAMCPTTCLRGCFCKPGYFKDSISHQCVLEEDCQREYYHNSIPPPLPLRVG